jgi:hypothetical protein
LRGFDSGFTELHTKLDADMVLDFANYRRQNETLNRKSSYEVCPGILNIFNMHHIAVKFVQTLDERSKAMACKHVSWGL